MRLFVIRDPDSPPHPVLDELRHVFTQKAELHFLDSFDPSAHRDGPDALVFLQREFPVDYVEDAIVGGLDPRRIVLVLEEIGPVAQAVSQELGIQVQLPAAASRGLTPTFAPVSPLVRRVLDEPLGPKADVALLKQALGQLRMESFQTAAGVGFRQRAAKEAIRPPLIPGFRVTAMPVPAAYGGFPMYGGMELGVGSKEFVVHGTGPGLHGLDPLGHARFTQALLRRALAASEAPLDGSSGSQVPGANGSDGVSSVAIPRVFEAGRAVLSDQETWSFCVLALDVKLGTLAYYSNGDSDLWVVNPVRMPSVCRFRASRRPVSNAALPKAWKRELKFVPGDTFMLLPSADLAGGTHQPGSASRRELLHAVLEARFADAARVALPDAPSVGNGIILHAIEPAGNQGN